MGYDKGFANGKVYFCSYAKERVAEPSLSEGEKLVYYLKGLGFRYNNRGNSEEMIDECLNAKRVGGGF